MGRAARSTAQLLLALLGLAAFLLLLDVLFDYADPVAKGLTDQLSRTTWITVLLITLGVLLLLELALVGRGGQAARRPDGPNAVYLLGCPACGTVFEHVDDGKGRFRCTNCLREGHFQPSAPLKAPVKQHVCERCGNSFEAYRDPAACPVCHLEQAVT